MSLFLFAVALSTSIIGSTCGIGGGVIIKPVLDAMNIMSVSSISFLSGCTVLAMSMVSVTRSILGKQARINVRTTPFLGLGAAAGGVLGKILFSAIKAAAGNETLVGLIQAILLAIVTIGTFCYMRMNNAGKIRTLKLTSPLVSLVIGFTLGIISSFLGIGGGPMNLAVLAFFFSMDPKEATTNSLCVILISQTASLIQSFATNAIPQMELLPLILMCCGGILGGLLGQQINKKLTNQQVSKLFSLLMMIVIGVCLYNIFRFAGAL